MAHDRSTDIEADITYVTFSPLPRRIKKKDALLPFSSLAGTATEYGFWLFITQKILKRPGWCKRKFALFCMLITRGWVDAYPKLTPLPLTTHSEHELS